MDLKTDNWSMFYIDLPYIHLNNIIVCLICVKSVSHFDRTMSVDMHSNRWHLMILLCPSWWIHHQFLLLLPHLCLRSLAPVRPTLSSTSFNRVPSTSKSSLHVERSSPQRFEGHSRFPAKLSSLPCSNLWQSVVLRWEPARYGLTWIPLVHTLFYFNWSLIWLL